MLHITVSKALSTILKVYNLGLDLALLLLYDLQVFIVAEFTVDLCDHGTTFCIWYKRSSLEFTVQGLNGFFSSSKYFGNMNQSWLHIIHKV